MFLHPASFKTITSPAIVAEGQFLKCARTILAVTDFPEPLSPTSATRFAVGCQGLSRAIPGLTPPSFVKDR